MIKWHLGNNWQLFLLFGVVVLKEREQALRQEKKGNKMKANESKGAQGEG